VRKHNKINFQGCKEVTDKGVMALALGCKDIASINLRDCSVTDTGLVVLAQNCKDITDITLTGCDVTDVGIVALAVNCKGTCPRLVSLPST
jgi:hypothetical protein